jgi:acyl-coenzyme A thioesterase PaaI-like protein
MNLKLLKETALLRAFGLFKIPLIFYCAPRVVELGENATEIVIPLNYRTKNHLGSMYFGAIAIGADVAGGLIAMRLIQEGGNQLGLVFKDFRAEFLKRPTADVHFRSDDGPKMKALVARAMATGERENETVEIVASCPSLSPEPVARCFLTISLKRKAKKS